MNKELLFSYFTLSLSEGDWLAPPTTFQTAAHVQERLQAAGDSSSKKGCPDMLGTIQGELLKQWKICIFAFKIYFVSLNNLKKKSYKKNLDYTRNVASN